MLSTQRPCHLNLSKNPPTKHIYHTRQLKYTLPPLVMYNSHTSLLTISSSCLPYQIIKLFSLLHNHLSRTLPTPPSFWVRPLNFLPMLLPSTFPNLPSATNFFINLPLLIPRLKCSIRLSWIPLDKVQRACQGRLIAHTACAWRTSGVRPAFVLLTTLLFLTLVFIPN